jgi:hypothetical protein
MKFITRILVSSVVAAIIVGAVFAGGPYAEEYSRSFYDYLMFFALLLFFVFHSVSLYSSNTERVVRDENGESVPRWMNESKIRSNLGSILFLVGLILGAVLLFYVETWLGIFPFIFFFIGAYLNFTKMCPYCKKINNFTEHKCRNCGRGLELFDS